ncbi:glutamate 5-kinase [uncultured Umboniibacter sp.]|uniref:glutamate 5-kinase n=1 Tax=uncultured Umboniibacter sp. TaxID=1798917 RepID=UPI00260C4CE3|nr:glutamate 5-kinase [uncultured Umboniibacter sp.]
MANQRWVVKLGSSSLTNHGTSLATEALSAWVADIAVLMSQGFEIVVVSSGAVAAGMARLNMADRPTQIAQLQAIAAIGQSDLVQAWRDEFAHVDTPVAQVLLNHSDIANRERYLNARAAIQVLLDLSAVPIVNENDSVATDEIRLGDNDNLAALVANLIDADGLLLLTDQDGLFTGNPNVDLNAELISEAFADEERLMEYASGSGTNVGTGGMSTKVSAARLAARSGTRTVIANAAAPQVVQRVINGARVGTQLLARSMPLRARKQWLAGHIQHSGVVVVDAGAREHLEQNGSSLLPVGIVGVQGNFQRGAGVIVQDESGKVFARGLTNFSAVELRDMAGKSSRVIAGLLGFEPEREAIHRDNLVLL